MIFMNPASHNMNFMNPIHKTNPQFHLTHDLTLPRRLANQVAQARHVVHENSFKVITWSMSASVVTGRLKVGNSMAWLAASS